MSPIRSFRSALALAAITAAMVALNWATALASSPGDLDHTFSSDGIQTSSFGPNEDHARAALIQPNGRIVVAGDVRLAGRNDSDFGVARYLDDGTPDSTWSDDGLSTANFRGGKDVARTVLRQSNGRIVVAGDACEIEVPDNCAFAVARFLVNGALDPSFGGDGRVRLAFPGFTNMTGFRAVLQPDGKIVVAGDAFTISTDDEDIAVARLLPNGALDTSFSKDGRATFDPSNGGSDGAGGVVIQSDGKIVLARWAYVPNSNDGRFALLRLLPNGTLDTTFSGDGVLIKNVEPGNDEYADDLLLLPSKSFLAVGNAQDAVGPSTATDVVLMRVLPTGKIDTTFGTGGVTKADFGANEEPFDAARDSHGRFVLVGVAGGRQPFAVYRFRPNGTPDTSFGTTGQVLLPNAQFAGGVALEGDDRIVATGVTDNPNGDFVTARFLG